MGSVGGGPRPLIEEVDRRHADADLTVVVGHMLARGISRLLPNRHSRPLTQAPTSEGPAAVVQVPDRPTRHHAIGGPR
jgi:hypothetical protein